MSVTVTSLRQSHRVNFHGGNGSELAGIVDAATQRSDGLTAPVVVFSHCFTCNKDLKAIVRIARSLSESGVTVLRFDMTGLGDSAGDFSNTNFSTNVADLRAAIAYATAELGPVQGLIGHSFGGAASLAVAGDPQSATALRSIATLAAPADTYHLADLMDRMNPSIARDGIGEVEIGGRRWLIRREMTADFRSRRLADFITQIKIPLLVLHSPSDETVTFDQALRLFQLASTRPSGTFPPPVSLVALDRADHLLAESKADLVYVAELLAAFLRRHST